MGRSLIVAAKENLVPGTTDPPRITLRLTRLDPHETGVDSRISQTVRCLREMGIDVELGERDNLEVPTGRGGLGTHFQEKQPQVSDFRRATPLQPLPTFNRDWTPNPPEVVIYRLSRLYNSRFG